MLGLLITLDLSELPVPTGRWFRSVRVGLVFVGFFVVAVAIHYPGFHSRMIYDSQSLLLGNAHVFSRHDLREVIAIAPQRSLFMASLYVNYLLSGMDAFSFRLVNATILAAAGLALTLLTWVLLEISLRPKQLSDLEKQCLSILVGLIFVVHPLQRLVVLYIWQREAIMACLFYYAALTAYVAGRSGMFGHQMRWYVVTSMLVLAGILSKENTMSFPVTAIVAEWVLFRGNVRQHLRQAIPIALIVALPFLFSFCLLSALHQPQTPRDHDGYRQPFACILSKGGADFSEGTVDRVPRVVLLSLHDHCSLRLQRTAAQSRSHLTIPVEPSGNRCRGPWHRLSCGSRSAAFKETPVGSLGILFFLITLLPESLMIPQYLFCGYRAILPMAGVLMVLADALATLRARPEKSARQLAVFVPVVLIVCLGAFTFSQAKRWNPFSFWKDAYAHLPEYSPDVEKYPYLDVLSSYASELGRSGLYPPAIGLFKEAIEVEVDPKSDKKALAIGDLGMTLIRSGNTAEGIRYLKEVVDLYPRGAWARYNLGIALFNHGQKDAGLKCIRKAVELFPDDLNTRVGFGDILRETGNYSEAVVQYPYSG